MGTTPYAGRLVSLYFTDLGMGNQCYAGLTVTPRSSPVTMVGIEVYDTVHHNLVMKQLLHLSRSGPDQSTESFLGPLSLEPRKYYFKVTWVDPLMGMQGLVPLAGPGPREGTLVVAPNGTCSVVP